MDDERIALLVNEVRGHHDLPASLYRAYLEEMLDVIEADKLEIKRLQAIVDKLPEISGKLAEVEAKLKRLSDSTREAAEAAGEVSDLVHRLRCWCEEANQEHAITHEAADEIERLQAIVEKLPAWADTLKQHYQRASPYWGDTHEVLVKLEEAIRSTREAAEKAAEGKGENDENL